jgi:hypothetical protein
MRPHSYDLYGVRFFNNLINKTEIKGRWPLYPASKRIYRVTQNLKSRFVTIA